jgi:hypothetical protein
MKQYKALIYETAAVWVFIIFVGFFFGLPLWRELSAEDGRSTEFYAATLATFFLMAIAFVIFCRLKYWFAWLLALIALAILGTGLDPPHRFLLYPDKHTLGGAVITFVAVLMFWLLEKLVMMYTGADISGQSDDLIEEDEITALNIEDKYRDAKTAPNKT